MQSHKKPGTYTATTGQGVIMETAADNLASAAVALGKLAGELLGENPDIEKVAQGTRKIIQNLDKTITGLEERHAKH
jgi:hypothetical protein